MTDEIARRHIGKPVAFCENGKLEMLRRTVAGQTLTASAEGAPARIVEVGAWRAFGTSLDMFERVE